jgi:hypothetical protein
MGNPARWWRISYSYIFLLHSILLSFWRKEDLMLGVTTTTTKSYLFVPVQLFQAFVISYPTCSFTATQNKGVRLLPDIHNPYSFQFPHFSQHQVIYHSLSFYYRTSHISCATIWFQTKAYVEMLKISVSYSTQFTCQRRLSTRLWPWGPLN